MQARLLRLLLLQRLKLRILRPTGASVKKLAAAIKNKKNKAACTLALDYVVKTSVSTNLLIDAASRPRLLQRDIAARYLYISAKIGILLLQYYLYSNLPISTQRQSSGRARLSKQSQILRSAILRTSTPVLLIRKLIYTTSTCY